MLLAPDDGELEIANAAAAYLANAMPIERLHGEDGADLCPALREQFGEMGWFALSIAEAAGGSELSPVEHALFFEEAGRLCGPIDILSQSLAAMMVTDQGVRSAVIAGAVGVALAIADGDQVRIFGSPTAHYAIECDRNGARLFELDGLETDLRNSLAPSVSMRLTAALGSCVDEVVDTRPWTMGQLGTAAMLVGIAQATLDQIVEYAGIRETFGKKIGGWQAVRHPCADMAIRVEAARSQLYYAATALKEGREDAAVHLDTAKHLANTAAVANADSNIQLHGGIGVTDEHSAHLFMKHSLVLSKIFGARRELLGNLLHAHVGD